MPLTQRQWLKSSTRRRGDGPVEPGSLFLRNVLSLFLLGVVFSLPIAGCGKEEASSPPISISGHTMGTRYNIKIPRLPEGISPEGMKRDIDAALERVNEQMSAYLKTSEISRFNRSTGEDWFSVSPETAQVVTAALKVSKESDGAFDVTVGPLIRLWRFGPDKQEKMVPGEAEIRKTMASIGYHKIKVRRKPPALGKGHADIQINLSAIAKGFGVDQIAGVLQRAGVTDYLVEIGGELRTRGSKADGRAWTIGIETPTDYKRSIQETIHLGDRAMATSGDYRNFFKKDGKRYSHTIDPTTGRPVEHQLASVSMIADNCMEADAWATALMVLGPDRGYSLAVKKEFAVLFLIRTDDGFMRRATPEFNALVQDRKD
ncbi:FAD:protein FMN transferase [Thermodesulfobacteriota bacterium]